MANTKVELNIAGFNELRNSAPIQADLMRRAEAIATAAGPGFVATPVRAGGRRSHASVRTETSEARMAEAKDGALTRAIDAGRS